MVLGTRLDGLLKEAGLVSSGEFAFVGSTESKPEYLMIDVGLSSGAPHSAQWLARNFERRLLILGFEPLPENVESIKAGSGGETGIDPTVIGKKFFLFPFALGPENGAQPLFVTEDPGQCSMLKPVSHESHLRVRRIQEVPMFTLDTVLDAIQNLPPEVTYLKTDCQGFDRFVLEGATKTLRRTVLATIEVEAPHYGGNIFSQRRAKMFMLRRGFIYLGPLAKKIINRIAVIQLDTSDRTFLNIRFLRRILSLPISIWQKW